MNTDIDYLLAPNDVAKLLSVSRSAINKWIAKGIFPKPFELAAKCPRWRISTINEWIDKKASPESEQDA